MESFMNSNAKSAAGFEVILGSINDTSFGPIMMFGKIQAARIMEGLPGEAPRDREALAAGNGVKIVDAKIILK